MIAFDILRHAITTLLYTAEQSGGWGPHVGFFILGRDESGHGQPGPVMGTSSYRANIGKF